MIYQKLTKRIWAFGVVLAVAACSAPPPYVHIVQEFNRDSDAYRYGITNRNDVKICYSTRNATPRQVTALAVEECAHVSKRAVFRGQSLQVCPLVTPVAALYDCVENASNAIFSSRYH